VRKTKEMLRLHHELGLINRAIAKSLRVSHSTVMSPREIVRQLRQGLLHRGLVDEAFSVRRTPPAGKRWPHC